MAKPPLTYPRELYQHGVALAVVSIRRNLSTALPPRIKSLNFLNNILAKHEASTVGAFDGLMLNADGYVTECTASNIFFVCNNRLCTPSMDSGILDGVTREIVLLLASEHRLQTEERSYRVGDLLGADECFLTNTSMELMPVRSINDRPIGDGRPGRITGRLTSLFRSTLHRFLDA
jgi:branched-chain amino acid aminotransferase